MTTDPKAKGLLEAAGRVDVIDAAGRIIANPRRNAVAASAAEALALAWAVERFWEVAIEAEVLVRLLQVERADFATSAGYDATVAAAQAQIARINELMNEIRGTEEEKTDASVHS